MQPLTAARTLRPDEPPPRPRDPAPSRLAYRWHRLWLTPVFRALLRVGLPTFAVVFAVGAYFADEGRREALVQGMADLRRSIEERPEFMVNLLAIEGASPALGDAIRAAVPVDLPVSSFDLDLEEMRRTVAALDPVASAELRVRPGGILELVVVERVPAILWRSGEDLLLLDAGGHRLGPLDSRLDRPDLPVIAGEGAERAVPEALALIAAAEPVAPRLRGLVRMGERRWDVVLDRSQRILLPEAGAVAALERVMALHQAEDMLARDVTVIDMRNESRPTIRLAPQALDELRRVRSLAPGVTNG